MPLKFLHILLAINLWFSSTGIAVFEHLCQMKGRKTALFAEPKSCCDKKQGKTCAQTNTIIEKQTGRGAIFSQTPCCTDQSQFLKSNHFGTVKKIEKQSIKVHPQFSVPIPAVGFQHNFVPLDPKSRRFQLYKPPPLASDIRVFIQSFLC